MAQPLRLGLKPSAQRRPQYLPYPQPIRRGWIPVPNASAVNFPGAQFGPAYLSPGSPSYLPYQYPDGDKTKVLYGGDEQNLANWRDSRPTWVKAGALAVGAFFVGYFLGRESQRQAEW